MRKYLLVLFFVFGSTLGSSAVFAQVKEGNAKAAEDQKSEDQEGEKDEESDAAALEQLTEVSKKMMDFQSSPTQENFSSISEMVEANSDFIIRFSQQNGADRLMSTFLARASVKYDFDIVGEGEIFQLAKDIAANNEQNEVANFVNDNETVTPAKLDVWWVSFFATGDTDYLERILAQVNSEKILIKGAAEWSFKSNCANQPEVKAFAEKAVEDEAWAEQREFLKECISPAEE